MIDNIPKLQYTRTTRLASVCSCTNSPNKTKRIKHRIEKFNRPGRASLLYRCGEQPEEQDIQCKTFKHVSTRVRSNNSYCTTYYGKFALRRCDSQVCRKRIHSSDAEYVTRQCRNFYNLYLYAWLVDVFVYFDCYDKAMGSLYCNSFIHHLQNFLGLGWCFICVFSLHYCFRKCSFL